MASGTARSGSESASVVPRVARAQMVRTSPRQRGLIPGGRQRIPTAEDTARAEEAAASAQDERGQC